MINTWKSLSSSKVSMALLFLFIMIIATATFLEERYDTATAKLLIYNAKWFEALMLALAVLFLINTFTKNLYSRGKLPQLLLHFSFVIMIIGGGVTRYFGYEANMHIYEEESVNELYTLDPYFQLKIPDKKIDYSSRSPLYFSQIGSNEFILKFGIEEYGNIKVAYKEYVFDAYELFQEHGQKENISSYYDRNSIHDSPDALIIDLSIHNKNKEVILFYDDTKYTQEFKSILFDGMVINLTYGPKPVSLPFSLKLEEFTLSKYPGSDIPSASESRVTLIDSKKGIVEEHLIAKNKVLDYGGYRFFQTSYDDDENGTILSINYDYYGTRITYAGYGLLLLASILLLLSRKSHFRQLDSKIRKLRHQRKSLYLLAFLLIGINLQGISQGTVKNPIGNEHADNFGKALVQTYDGRFSTVHSLALDVIHKISGKESFNNTVKGSLTPMQFFLDLQADPDFWYKQKLIIIRDRPLREFLGISGNYASLADLTKDNQYILDEQSLKAYKKKAADQSRSEREILNVTDRVNILLMTINGTILKLFPFDGSKNHQWISWNDSLALTELRGDHKQIIPQLQGQELTYSNIMRSYFISTIYARESGDYSIPDKILDHIKNIQRQLTPQELLPSENKIKLEVFYNKSRIFENLRFIFAFIGFILLVLSFIENFTLNPLKIIRYLTKIFIILFFLAFIYQSFGMGLRWYLGGHAPWSNGYEVLLLVAWGGIIAGLSVIKYSKITLASTALLAAVVLMIAGLSYYDPQLTNLNPVLKSYWLIIHVAVITIGYGFLGLSLLLGFICILIGILVSNKSRDNAGLVVQELTLINEKLVTMGVLLTAIGTFIGCIWANESWGNYWSWNAKQTWSLIIILIYGVILHFRYIPGLKTSLAFNTGAIISFGSVIMTFIGVNYYFTKGLHSYAADDPPIFPIWAWITIIALFSLIVAAIAKENYFRKDRR